MAIPVVMEVLVCAHVSAACVCARKQCRVTHRHLSTDGMVCFEISANNQTMLERVNRVFVNEQIRGIIEKSLKKASFYVGLSLTQQACLEDMMKKDTVDSLS